MLETLNYDTGRGGYNMADYRLPMDADGVKYHGTVDQNEENPGQFMYGLDENGNKRIIRTDEQGNVLTQVTGSNVELEVYKGEDLSGTIGSSYNKPSGASKAVIEFVIEKKDDNPDGRISIVSLNRLSGSRHDSIEISSGRIYESGRFLFFWGFNNINDYELADNILGISTSPIPPINTFAHVITVRDGGVFDVTTNVSYFV